MPIEAKVYNVLIASPGDVTEERDIIRSQIYRWNALHTVDMRIILLPVGWETNATPSLEERGQGVINRQLVNTCDLVIGVFWTRLGTPTPEAASGTVEEIERASKEGKRCIIYFSDREVSLSKTNQKQYKRLQEYKKTLQAKGLTDSYISSEEFREKVFRHITSAVLEIAREDKERRVAEQEAKLTEQALGLPVQTIPITSNLDISFDTFNKAQASVRTLLKSRFGIQDMEDAKDQEIARIKSVLSSPDLAELLCRQPNAETIPAIAQIIETATTPSMYAISAIGRYADERSLEWLDITGDWIEQLSTKNLENGYEWARWIKIYPGLLLLYALGIAVLRAGKMNFLQEVVSRQIYLSEYNYDRPLLNAIDPRYVFYDNISSMIEPGFERRYTPISDHLAPLLKSKLYPNEEDARYLNWFDLLEFLFSFKTVQQLEEHPYYGAFTWRVETNRFMFGMFQDAVLQQGRYGSALSDFFKGRIGLEETAVKYDNIASQSRSSFGRVNPPSYISQLIQLAKANKRISSYQELINYFQTNV